ncbi:MAG: helix-turn-helix domain-containing protein [Xenococcaceae cyanobacterium]
MSPYHFGKLFKQSTGKSPHQYVLQCRVERSQQLLADEKLSLAEITQTAKLCNQSYSKP